MKWITTLIGNIDRKNLVPSKVIAALYNFCCPKRWNSLTAEESMELVRQEYKRRNRDKESWMTKHDREPLDWQKARGFVDDDDNKAGF